MGINDRPGPGDSVYGRDEDDTEGHGSGFKRSATGGDEDDTEGHGRKLRASGGDEDDTEGHGSKPR